MKRLLAFVGGAGVAAGALLAFFLDPSRGRRRRKQVVDQCAGFFRRQARRAVRAGRGVSSRMYGLTMKATHLHEQPKPQPDDATLARKVESEIFRPADAPKGTVNVNAENGVICLRGEAPTPEMINRLFEQACKVQGVKGVKNLLHLPNAPVRSA